ncbi:MAG: YncE family protein, partial [Micromonosporaceae bacterium]
MRDRARTWRGPDRRPGSAMLRWGWTPLLVGALLSVAASPPAPAKVIDIVTVGASPMAVAVNLGRGYAANLSSDTVSVFNTLNHNVIDTVPVGDAPVAVAANPFRHTIYVANRDSGTVSVIDSVSDGVANTVRVGGSPQYLAVHPSGLDVYVTSSGTNTVAVINAVSNSV